ncbi:hypothetical protein ALQ32_04512 [Pseudomonas syringae pv. tagetis]|uniref:Uncharacterized protein n=1 Tax=Pseudomonas syringae pv. tagetis TaxID=129140 RepID=A0A3M3Z111_9PSED|nr:hypothetical protein ALQ32_04512 [Pseudomonas syringae pv. tagetis]
MEGFVLSSCTRQTSTLWIAIAVPCSQNDIKTPLSKAYTGNSSREWEDEVAVFRRMKEKSGYQWRISAFCVLLITPAIVRRWSAMNDNLDRRADHHCARK